MLTQLFGEIMLSDLEHMYSSLKVVANKNKKLLVSIYLIILIVIINISYNTNAIVQAGYPGQFDGFQSDSEKVIYDFVQLKLNNENSSNFFRPFEFALHARIFNLFLHKLKVSLLSMFPLSVGAGFLESYAPVEVSHMVPEYIAYPIGTTDQIMAGDIIVFQNNGPRIVIGLKKQKIKEILYLNKTIFREVPSGIIFNISRADFPSIEHKINASLNRSISFLGYEMSQEQLYPEQSFSITYYWKCLKNVSKDYCIFVHLVPVSNSKEINETISRLGHNILFNMDHEPLDNVYPTSRWIAGEVIAERFEYMMPSIPEGTYKIVLGMYDKRGNGERLEVIPRDLGDNANQISAGSAKILKSGAEPNIFQSLIVSEGGQIYFLADFFIQTFFLIVRPILVFFTSIVIILLVYLVYKSFGWGVSFIYFWALCSSDWLIFYARNYYWIFFLYLVPLVLSFWLYPIWGKAHKKLFLSAIFFSVLIRSLIDFEYVTNLILMPLVPIIYYDTLNRDGSRKVVHDCLLAFASGFAGFLAGLSIHIISLYKDSPSNFVEILTTIIIKVVDRTGVDNAYAKDLIKGYAHPIFNQIHPYNNDLASQILYVIDNRISYEQVNIITIPVFHWGLPLYIIELIVFLICYHEVKKYLEGSGDQNSYSLCIATIASFIASNSWAILTANGHMKYHLHMNPVIFYLPFLLTAFILISAKLRNVFNAIIRIVRV